MTDCYCQSGKTYATCCQPLHQGTSAATPLSLMRSRYSAFVLNLGDYLWHTHHPDFRGDLTPAKLSVENTDWQKLDILLHCYRQGYPQGWVEFKAWFRNSQQQLQFLHERSHFLFEQGRWWYADGLFQPSPIARNQPCPCGSQDPFKHCCQHNPLN